MILSYLMESDNKMMRFMVTTMQSKHGADGVTHIPMRPGPEGPPQAYAPGTVGPQGHTTTTVQEAVRPAGKGDVAMAKARAWALKWRRRWGFRYGAIRAREDIPAGEMREKVQQLPPRP